jgi:signal transduction histidine kinase
VSLTPGRPPRWAVTSSDEHETLVAPHRGQGRRLRRAATIRGALLIGFVCIFGLWVLSGYELVRRVHDLERRTVAEQQAAVRGERLLSTVRTNVLLGSIYLRDALIDNRQANADYYRTQLNDIRSQVQRLLPSYVIEVASSEERAAWVQLQTELEEYWKSRELIFSPAAPLTTNEAAAVLRGRVVPNRNAILTIIDRLSELQSLSQERHEAEFSALYSGLRNRLFLIGAIAIAIGVIVALLATRYVAHLQRQIEAQRDVDRQTRRDLERLSARLVTVQEQERRSLARELHDEVGQALTAIKMDLTMALRGLESGAGITSTLEDARSIADNTLQGVRDLSQLLHPSTLDDFGLPTTVASWLHAFSKRTGIRTTLTHTGMDARLSPEHELCVFRITQEALTNVARHSSARHATVSLHSDEHQVTVTVEDDGRGCDLVAVRARQAGGIGIIGMRERAQTLGGSFALEPPTGGGTRVVVRLPSGPTAENRSDAMAARRVS